MSDEIIEVPYGDMYLKFTDEAQSIEVLEGYEGSIDVIGAIEDAEGWHVNTRGPMPEAFTPFAVHPTQPQRIWA
jgi:hypothetical protein